ncbi:urease subunit gamma/beta [Haloactinospora alba]|uniref:urease n=1 Tax=Haloactinospora alba TaxID=405555 RepID=A0A543NL90_9ACTN|nr:urease subunit gamma [Haloactinospora alba]TQN32590.1 urease subunit gamma/beta [Haloactinospora alba]
MHLTPREQERLLLFTAADLARRRLARGASLGSTEAIALVCDGIQEDAWDGLTLQEVVRRAQQAVAPENLLPGVPDAVPELQVEALFPHGSSLVHVPRPFGAPGEDGAGAVRTPAGEVALAPGRPRTSLEIRNTGERTVWLSSHFPLEEANAALEFDRGAAAGHRLDLPAGTSMEFPAGECRTVTTVARGGQQ